jgi:hypothetical protein
VRTVVLGLFERLPGDRTPRIVTGEPGETDALRERRRRRRRRPGDRPTPPFSRPASSEDSPP